MASTYHLALLAQHVLELHDMEPTVGRIVHYFFKAYSIDGEVTEMLPAIITKVHSSTLVNLGVFADDYIHVTSVPFGDGEPRTWVWPPRV